MSSKWKIIIIYFIFVLWGIFACKEIVFLQKKIDLLEVQNKELRLSEKGGR